MRYLDQWSTAKFKRANLDGTAIQDLATSGREGHDGIALGATAEMMHWTTGARPRSRRIAWTAPRSTTRQPRFPTSVLAFAWMP